MSEGGSPSGHGEGDEGEAGRTEGMLAVSLIMIATAAVVFIVARTLGMKRIFS